MIRRIAFGLSATGVDSIQSARLISDEIGMWGKAVRTSGAKVE